MKILQTLTVVAGILAGSFAAQTALAAGPVKAKNVVLVHGAWADGSSWAQVIPKLQAAGLHVTAVQNPLSSLEDSVAETRRVLPQQDGPTVLVAHSWGGTVISEVGTDPKVTGLVYIAARAFERAFQLADFVQVKNASLENGLLHVDLVREIPEAKKPRSIPINSGAQAPQVVDASVAA